MFKTIGKCIWAGNVISSTAMCISKFCIPVFVDYQYSGSSILIPPLLPNTTSQKNCALLSVILKMFIKYCDGHYLIFRFVLSGQWQFSPARNENPPVQNWFAHHLILLPGITLPSLHLQQKGTVSLKCSNHFNPNQMVQNFVSLNKIFITILEAELMRTVLNQNPIWGLAC